MTPDFQDGGYSRRWSWYLARLKAMPWPEWSYRGVQTLRRARRRHRGWGEIPAPAAAPPSGSARRIEIFDLVLEYPWGEPIDWSRDYKSGRSAPKVFYGDLDYRDAGSVGDSKYTWELNRHQFLAPWALEFRRTGDEDHAEAVVQVILDWIAANPRYLGINWCSSLELALRILAWGVALDLCAASQAARRARPRIAASVAEQADYIRHTLSLYSSANNHLLGELVGLLAARVFFPEVAVGRQSHYARKRFVAEALRQNFADGVNREQSVYYHHYVLEYVLTALSLFERVGWPAPSELLGLGERMLEFLDAVTDDRGGAFPVGDSDDGTVTGLNLGSGVGIYESLLWSGWLLFGTPHLGAHAARIALARGAAPLPDRRSTYWHRGRGAAVPDPTMRKGRRLFPEGGYFVSEDGPFRLLFKAGPFGYPGIAAHSHCDQLAVALNCGASPVLTDCGTYVYHTEERWRRFFKGTSAHNTVGVDGRDQAEYAGPFLWSTHADGRLELAGQNGNSYELRGVHDGYRRISDPVDHERRVIYREGLGYRIVDRLRGRRTHLYELYWNFGGGVRLQPLGPFVPGEACQSERPAWRVVFEGGECLRFVMESDPPAELRWYHGDEALPAGFESTAYLERRPIHHLRLVVNAPACEFRTYVLIREGASVGDWG